MSSDTASPGTFGAHHGFQAFSSPSDAPRVRRQSDLVSALVGAAFIVFLAIVVGNGAQFDQSWADMLPSVPGWVLWVSKVAYVVAVISMGLLVLGVGFIAHRRLELFRDLILAGALAALATAGISRWIDARWPELPLFSFDATSTTFPAFFVAVFIAVQSAAAPHLSAPLRRVGWSLTLAGAAGAVLGGVSQPSDTLAALLVGLVAAAVIRLAFGTSAGVPSLNRIIDGLGQLGLVVSDLTYSHEQPPESTLVEGSTGDGDPVVVRVLGRDAWSDREWTRLWRSAWYVDGGEQYASSRREQVEHEALVSFLAAEAGVAVRDVMAVGMTASEDGMLARHRTGRLFADLEPSDITDELLGKVWSTVVSFHDAALAHGRLDGTSIWVDHDGRVGLTNFTESAIAASDTAQGADIVELLTASALAVGQDRAIASARNVLGDDLLIAALPLMQPAALTSKTKNAARHQKLKVDDLRKEVATEVGSDPPEVQQLQRVSLKNIITIALVGFAVYTVVSGLADVGFDTIIDALDGAKWGLVLLALVATQATNATDAMSVASASPKPVPVGIATVEQFAIGFVNLAVPSSAGRILVNVRFFEKFGINAVTSSTTGAITGVAGFAAQMILLVLTIIVGKGSIDLSDLKTGGGGLRILGMAVVIIVVGGLLVIIVPKWRHWVGEKIREPLKQMGKAFAVMRKPKNVIGTFGGAIASELLFATGLLLCVLAVGGSVSLGQAVFINVVVSLFAGLMPIPGGIGVAEAGLTAGLVGVGVENDTAVAAVLIYRLCSYYLPPIWGWLSMRWLQNHDYL